MSKSADVLDDPLGRNGRGSGFLPHLNSLTVTMSQKSSVPQAPKSVSKVLMGDSCGHSRSPPPGARLFSN
jgi:hypothetical protein